MTDTDKSLIEIHGREHLLETIKTAFADHRSLNDIKGSKDASVLGWELLRGMLDLRHEIGEPVWLADAPGSVQISATVTNPYGGTQTAHAVGTVNADAFKRHVELSKVQSFAMRRAMMDAWRGLLLVAGIDLGRAEDDDLGDDSAQSAPQRPQNRAGGAKRAQAATAASPPETTPTAKPVDNRLAAATRTRKALMAKDDNEVKLAEYDAKMAMKGWAWNEADATYEQVEE